MNLDHLIANTHTGVKICGITTAQQSHEVVAAGADALGFNFWPKSKRFLEPTAAAPWLHELRGAVLRVGVFVNPDDATLRSVVEADLIDVVQLHGDETAERCLEVSQLGLPIIKAFQVKDETTLGTLGQWTTQAWLLDSYNPGLYGGEGKSFPWHLAGLAKSLFTQVPIILAGGLTPENVGRAVQDARPAAVDVASSVESAPGVKDLGKVREFIARAREVVP